MREVELLKPALVGFPVEPLVDMYLSAEPERRVSAHQLLDVCFDAWIESLEGALDERIAEGSDAVSRIQDTQRGTRDALRHLKARLSRAEVVRPERGQVC